MMTLEFIEKRIEEQKEYIEKIMLQQQEGKISMGRSLEIIRSAMGVLEYFENKKKQYEKKQI